ncbi:arsenate reductase (glutaredoxin) [Cognatishimia sp. SS12]|uniref:arsenate reductase (glutaredoxin) n=1 Tax=Cognatishimia sp. SS12 TaxID=2979465 RepID=UPI0023302DF9|nr:arsenate reductase (glutaredoxin) [Cognatishimia sp. SS12]MDC0736734.1 arsenate reductase (glutaredoxin) [Cognatishimia sp. SS12]
MITIWHNPRCSKSRQTLALIEAKGAVRIRKYLEDSPSAEELRAVLKLLGIPAIDLMRKGEEAFKTSDLTADSPEDALIAAMVATPKLIERPVVLANGQARLGRPPEAVLDIL